jgi:hypothetical protein
LGELHCGETGLDNHLADGAVSPEEKRCQQRVNVTHDVSKTAGFLCGS